MFNYFGQRRQQTKLNTLALFGNLDEVEILQDIETTFGIRFSDSEAEALLTVGDLEAAIREKLMERPDFDPVWALVEYISRTHSNSRHDINQDTTFFAHDPKTRER